MSEWNEGILEALSHPIRRQILESLREKTSLSYTELLEHVNISNHGKLGFHLRRLKGFVERHPSTGKYLLTDMGQLASELAWDIRFIVSRGSRDLTQEPTRYVKRLVFGDHAFFLFNSANAKHDIAFSFLEAGLAKKEAAIYLVPEHRLDSESREVQKCGIGANCFRNAFTLMSADEWYLRKGKAQPKRILNNWLKLLKKKQDAGLTGLRVAGEMDVFLDNSLTKELLEYETLLGKKLQYDMCGLCIYDVHKIDEDLIVQLTKCHSHLISKDIAWKIA